MNYTKTTFICLIFCMSLLSTTLFATPYDWFITYLKLDTQIAHIGVSITAYDPIVRLYNEDTNELIVTLQRITPEGNNTNLSNDNRVTVEIIRLPNGQELVQICENGIRILSLQIGAEMYTLNSYMQDGTIDLQINSLGRDAKIVSRIALNIFPIAFDLGNIRFTNTSITSSPKELERLSWMLC